MVSIEAGQLRDRVTVEVPNAVDADNGERVIAYEPLRQVWAKVTPLNSGERMRAMSNGLETTHKVTLRYANDITDDCRLLLGERVLNIQSLIDVENRHVRLDLLCAETTKPTE